MAWQALFESHYVLANIPSSLANVVERRETVRGEVLHRLGDRVESMLAVISGELRLVRADRNGAEIILQRSRAGFLAEASLHSKTYHCDIVAAEASVLLRFPVEDFRCALDEDKAFRDAWMAQLAREVRRLRAQCERLSLHTASDRILHFIESEGTNGSVLLDQSKKAWAAELGLTHEALYRSLGKLKANGILMIEGKRVTMALSG